MRGISPIARTVPRLARFHNVTNDLLWLCASAAIEASAVGGGCLRRQIGSAAAPNQALSAPFMLVHSICSANDNVDLVRGRSSLPVLRQVPTRQRLDLKTRRRSSRHRRKTVMTSPNAALRPTVRSGLAARSRLRPRILRSERSNSPEQIESVTERGARFGKDTSERNGGFLCGNFFQLSVADCETAASEGPPCLR